jgi:predicted metal-binding membrane protein
LAAATNVGRRVTLTTVSILLALAAVAWYYTVRQAGEMSGMVTGLAQIGSGMPGGMAPPVFLGMWLTMMVAMMFPTIGPMVLAHRVVVRHRGEGWPPTAAFVLGYLFIWSAIGLVPLGAFLAFRNLTATIGSALWLRGLAGAILLVAGLYQFTPWKAVCLKACRSPFAFLLEHDFGGGTRSAFRAGVSHGAFCLGCCWALMSVLVVVGLMNLVWMAGLALIFLAEKNWRHGAALSKVAGIAVALLGLTVIVLPGFLAWIGGGMVPATGGGM